MRIVTRFYPGGEIRVSKYQRVRKENPDRGVSAPLVHSPGFQESSFEVDHSDGREIAGVKPGWGMLPREKSFTLHARRTIKRVGAMLTHEGWPQYAITLTLPGSGVDAYSVLCEWSGYAANRVKTWLYDQITDSETFEYFYVWEFQSRGALHLHACVRIDSESDVARVKNGIKALWIKTLEDIEERSGVCLFRSPYGVDWRIYPEKIRVDFQRVREGVSNYFAKYCSKDSSKGGTAERLGLSPSSWWGCSRRLLQRMKSQTRGAVTVELPPSQADSLYKKIVNSVKDAAEWCAEYVSKVFEDVVTVGFLPHDDASKLYASIVPEIESIETCQLDRRLQGMEYRIARRFFRRAWRDNDGRLRLAAVIGTDTPEWETLARWQTDQSCVPQSHIIDLYNNIFRYEDEHDAEQEEEGGFILQLELSEFVPGA